MGIRVRIGCRINDNIWPDYMLRPQKSRSRVTAVVGRLRPLAEIATSFTAKGLGQHMSGIFRAGHNITNNRYRSILHCQYLFSKITYVIIREH